MRVLGGGLQSVPLFGFLPQRYNRGLRLAAGQLQDGQDLLAVQGVHPPFDGAALLLTVDEETAALARALYAKPGPDPRSLDLGDLHYQVTRLLLELEDDQLRERSDYNEAAQGEAERAGDRDAIDRLMNERRLINEARRSLDRRREETRLLASPRR